ncbi:hypothetical protein G155_00272 [Mycobacterium sp. VKM Ac-1817D]|nr:hypothetical protein G155_00272 [Mycobacterium sp. VKM Ac-1817D]
MTHDRQASPRLNGVRKRRLGQPTATEPEVASSERDVIYNTFA